MMFHRLGLDIQKTLIKWSNFDETGISRVGRLFSKVLEIFGSLCTQNFYS